MNKVIIMLGIPGSGKTTYAREYVKSNPRTIRTNKDSIRSMLFDGEYSVEMEDIVCSIRDGIIHDALDKMYDVIVDDTNVKKSHRANIAIIASNYEATVEFKDLTDVPLEVCLERNRNRPNPVPEEAIKRMHDQLKAQKKTHPWLRIEE